MRLILDKVNYIYEEGTITETPALHDIDLTIEQGELIAVIGHGGCGKSTLALLLTGLARPSSGKLQIISEGQSGDKLFSKVGMVFQYPEQQMFGATVFEEVAFGPRNFGVPEDYLPARVQQSLEAVGLDAEAMWERSPFALSGGQKRRVCIASVLASKPQMIILDEPTAGLDEASRRWLAELVQQLNEEGNTVVWITHSMEDAAQFAKRIVVLEQGRIILDGPPEQVFLQREQLQQTNLQPPFASRLVQALHEQGADIPARAVTVPVAVDEISAWLHEQQEANAEPKPQPVPESAKKQSKLRLLWTEAEQQQQLLSEEDNDEQWEQAAKEQLQAIVAPQEAQPEPSEEAPQQQGAAELPQVEEWQGDSKDV